MIFLIGLIFLIYFSYQDLKHSEINHKPIIAFLFVGLVVLLISENSLILTLICLFWWILGWGMWKFKMIGGSDVKILSILPVFYLSLSPNIYAGQIIFLVIFAFTSLISGLIIEKRTKKKYIPFVPIIALTYVINYLFWFIQ